MFFKRVSTLTQVFLLTVSITATTAGCKKGGDSSKGGAGGGAGAPPSAPGISNPPSRPNNYGGNWMLASRGKIKAYARYSNVPDTKKTLDFDEADVVRNAPNRSNLKQFGQNQKETPVDQQQGASRLWIGNSPGERFEVDLNAQGVGTHGVDMSRNPFASQSECIIKDTMVIKVSRDSIGQLMTIDQIHTLEFESPNNECESDLQNELDNGNPAQRFGFYVTQNVVDMANFRYLKKLVKTHRVFASRKAALQELGTPIPASFNPANSYSTPENVPYTIISTYSDTNLNRAISMTLAEINQGVAPGSELDMVTMPASMDVTLNRDRFLISIDAWNSYFQNYELQINHLLTALRHDQMKANAIYQQNSDDDACVQIIDRIFVMNFGNNQASMGQILRTRFLELPGNTDSCGRAMSADLSRVLDPNTTDQRLFQNLVNAGGVDSTNVDKLKSIEIIHDVRLNRL